MCLLDQYIHNRHYHHSCVQVSSMIVRVCTTFLQLFNKQTLCIFAPSTKIVPNKVKAFLPELICLWTNSFIELFNSLLTKILGAFRSTTSALWSALQWVLCHRKWNSSSKGTYTLKMKGSIREFSDWLLQKNHFWFILWNFFHCKEPSGNAKVLWMLNGC